VDSRAVHRAVKAVQAVICSYCYYRAHYFAVTFASRVLLLYKAI